MHTCHRLPLRPCGRHLMLCRDLSGIMICYVCLQMNAREWARLSLSRLEELSWRYRPAETKVAVFHICPRYGDGPVARVCGPNREGI